jgi:hypothetical protein
VTRLECPSRSDAVVRSTPFPCRWLQCVCLDEWRLVPLGSFRWRNNSETVAVVVASMLGHIDIQIWTTVNDMIDSFGEATFSLARVVVSLYIYRNTHSRLWECGKSRNDFQGRWKGLKTCLWFSRLPRAGILTVSLPWVAVPEARSLDFRCTFHVGIFLNRLSTGSTLQESMRCLSTERR